MLSSIYLVIVIIATVMQYVFKKQFNIKTNGKGGFAFCGVSAIFATLIFILYMLAGKAAFVFKAECLTYSVAFAVVYSIALVFSFLALKYGSLALTSLMISYSLLIPTFYGIIFLKDPVSVCLYGGIVLLMISLFLINYNKNEDTKFSLKWLVCVILAFIGNGMCSTVVNMQVVAFDGGMKSEFMIVAYAISIAIMLVCSLVYERRDIVHAMKKGSKLSVICGVFNGVVNLLVILLLEAKEIPTSVVFPSISAGGMVITYLISLTWYKEKMSKAQTAGFFIGVAAIILLNI